MNKKFLSIVLLFSFSLVFAEDSYKKKTFDTFTISFDTQKLILSIVNTEAKTYVTKEYLNDNESSEKPSEEKKTKSLAEKNLKKKTADDYTYADSIKTITIHGTIEELNTIYNALNSLDDCNNFDLKKMGFDYASASSISKDPETGKIIHDWDLIICELDWDE